MHNRNIRVLILGIVFTIIAFAAVQFYLINRAIKAQRDQDKIIQKQEENKVEAFNNKVIVALTNVRDNLVKVFLEEGAELSLEPVQMISDKYFVVSFHVKPDRVVLENFLLEEFRNLQIGLEYKVGIYDCFEDEIIFDENINQLHNDVNFKWEHDGYYFGVFFPEIAEYKPIPLPKISIIYIISIALVVFFVGFFAFTVHIILKQKRIDKIKTDFINNMTHELKTPIATIGLSTDLLLKIAKNNDNLKAERYLNIINIENNRLQSQVEKVLQLAKLEQDSIVLEKQQISIHQLIKECATTFELATTEKGGELILSLDSGEDSIIGDKTHISNVLYNLLDNALKYSTNHPKIKISTFNKNGFIFVEVEDNGVGLSNEAQKNIFERFYRVPTGNVHNIKGFGIGLYYVLKILDNHNGKIKVSSILGKGSKFTFSLPLMTK